MPGAERRAREDDGAADDAPVAPAKRARNILQQLGTAAAADGASSDDSGIASGKRDDAPPRAPPRRLNGRGKLKRPRERKVLKKAGKIVPRAADGEKPAAQPVAMMKIAAAKPGAFSSAAAPAGRALGDAARGDAALDSEDDEKDDKPRESLMLVPPSAFAGALKPNRSKTDGMERYLYSAEETGVFHARLLPLLDVENHAKMKLATFFGRKPTRDKHGPSKNFAAKLQTIRYLVNKFRWLDRSLDMVEGIWYGRLRCSLCEFVNAQSGGGHALEEATLARHAASDVHYAQEVKARQADKAAAKPRQATLSALAVKATDDIEQLDNDVLYTTVLAAGSVAAGAPYTTLPEFFSGRRLKIMRALRTGFPSTTTLRDTTLPAACRLVKGLLKGHLYGLRIAVLSDEGQTRLMNGKCVLAIMVSSPGLIGKLRDDLGVENSTGEFLLRAYVLEGSINSVSLARLVEETRSDYELGKPEWLAGDNAALNRKAARLLNVPFANCLAHSWSLFLEAFLNQMTMPMRVCFIRQWIAAGHSTERKALLVAYGLNFSSLDYSDTRWQGLLETMNYLVRQLTP